jgi:hypothetical protein
MKTREIEFRVWDKERKSFCFKNGELFGDTDFKNGIFNFKNGEEYYIFQQFTGLIDINNKKIFEGDIIKGKIKSNDVFVDYSQEVIFEYYGWNLNWDVFATGVKIIGNIFENPKLIKK